ncbi:hypothetical protein GDO81_022838 [Engystomops pustulosus]|uniref:Uncharacterized protein n=1 Tax=Engystomops pustulosus TaxID=76066 RepID=A0AAV6YX50_ENGPU|nr:hypothetical protein GDO81_022838 [Engystomops pustulosus]
MALREVLQLVEGVPVPGGPRVIRSEGSVEESWSPDAYGTWMLGERVCLPRALHPTVSQVAYGHIHIQNGHASAHKPSVVCPGHYYPCH